MADLTDIIEQQVRAAEDGEIDAPDPVETDDPPAETPADGDVETPEVVEGTEDSPDDESTNEPAKDDKEDVKDDDDEPEDEIEKILADAGFKPPQAGQRENRIPYSRSRKIIGNALKKDRAKQAEILAAKDKEIAPLKERAGAADNWDRLIASDPDRTIRELERLNPGKYQKYLDPKPTTTTTASSDAALGAKPGPDLKYEDGTVGYSPEQFEKREAWIIAKATTDANTANRAELDRRLGPMETERKAKETYEANLPKVRADRNRCVELYGKLFTDDEALGEKSLILKAMRDHKLSIPDAAAKVLVPLLQGNQTKLRAEIMKELKERQKGAAKTVTSPAATGSKRDPSETRTTEDVIAEAIRASGLK